MAVAKTLMAWDHSIRQNELPTLKCRGLSAREKQPWRSPEHAPTHDFTRSSAPPPPGPTETITRRGSRMTISPLQTFSNHLIAPGKSRGAQQPEGFLTAHFESVRVSIYRCCDICLVRIHRFVIIWGKPRGVQAVTCAETISRVPQAPLEIAVHR